MNLCSRFPGAMLLVALPVLLAACAPPMVRTVVHEDPMPIPTQVYFYPKHNQSAVQQDKDRYQCYLWARKQTGFDPSEPGLAPHQRLQVLPDPDPGHDTAVGVFTGAILGAMLTDGHDPVGGAVSGAMAGAIMGMSSDIERQQVAARVQAHYDRQTAQERVALERQAADYRRALTACLVGRGYSVR
jgi:hypothetical protein